MLRGWGRDGFWVQPTLAKSEKRRRITKNRSSLIINYITSFFTIHFRYGLQKKQQFSRTWYIFLLEHFELQLASVT